MNRIPPNATRRCCHPTREAIVEAIRWVGPLSSPQLAALLDDPGLPLAGVCYHVAALVDEGVLKEIGRRPAGPSIESTYSLAPP